MNRQRRTGMFPFYKSDQLQDWQLLGYYNNWVDSIIFVPRDTLKSFSTPPVDGVKTAPTQITARKLKIKGNIKTIVESTTFDININSQQIEDNTQTYYYFIQSNIGADNYLNIGELYELYLEDSDGNSFISNIFIAVEEYNLYITDEDGQVLTDEDGEGILFQ